jgi:hypothetical protein
MRSAIRIVNLALLPLLLLGARAAAQSRPADENVKTVYASKMGFDPRDATKALQSAIDSGAQRVIVENMGTPWIVDKIRLTSDQEIVFEKGVVVQAKRGAFKGTGDCLFTAKSQKNVTLSGYGATLKMWKEDYHAPEYQPAEWRHALSIRGCENVKVYGLTLASSGGDGIYLGVDQPGTTNTHIHIKDCICIDNNRQGISVISARHLLIENTMLKDTAGTSPQAGIDFEPNASSEVLSDIVMRNCVSENNRGGGFLFALNGLRGQSEEISIRLENCQARGRIRALLLQTINDGSPPKGQIEFVDCVFESRDDAGILIRRKPAAGCAVRFERCVVMNSALNSPADAPISFLSSAEDRQEIGGVEFADCRVVDPLKRLPISYQDFTGVGLRDITGTLAVERAGERVAYTLDRKQIDAWFPDQIHQAIKPFDTSNVRYVPLDPTATPAPNWKSTMRQRGRAAYRVFANAGERVALSALVQPVGNSEPSPVAVRLIVPSGEAKLLGRAAVGAESNVSFVADTTGDYQVECDAGVNTIQLNSTTHRVNQYAATGFFHYFHTGGDAFFYVPAGVREFGVVVAGANAAERVKAALCNPSGQIVSEQDSIAQARQLLGSRADASRGEVWSIRLSRPSSGVMEDYQIRLQGIPPVLASSPQALLKPAD